MRGLIEPFTTQPEAPASKKAGAFGWAVNESEQRASCTTGDDKILLVQKAFKPPQQGWWRGNQ
jgi:hypothetical protein